jgi:hypothetical protein
MSALPPKADICGALAHVCFGPEADIIVQKMLTSEAESVSRAGVLEVNTIVIGWYFDHFAELQPACLHRFDCFLW